jgi:hypothetical protein
VFLRVLQPLTFWPLAAAVVVVEMADRVAVVVRFNTQPVIR